MNAFRWGVSTDQGLIRTENEDAFVAEPLIFAVADGMGGHQAGEVASALAVETLRARLGGGVSGVDVVIAAVIEANAAIFHAAHENVGQQGMGTTLTALAVLPATAVQTTTLGLVNVGDSRTYRVRGGRLERVTLDHSYVQELVSTGHITEMEARTHPRRNIVTRALGIEPHVRVDSWVLSVVKGDRFVLCSDGLVDEVPDHEIELVATGLADPQAAANELVAMANRHGGRDNVTVVVLDVLEGLELSPGLIASDTPALGMQQPALTLPVVASAGVDADAASFAAPPSAVGPIQTLPVVGAPAVDPVAFGVSPSSQVANASRRRFTAGMFAFLFGAALILTFVVVMIAVVVSGDDAPSPSSVPVVPESTIASPPDTAVNATEPATLPPTTLPPATLAPTTLVPSTPVPSTPAPATGAPTTLRAPAPTPTTAGP